jgi:hypothetical protein
MNTQQVVHSLPVSFDSYIRHGWKLIAIPPNSKGPHNAAWNRPENAIVDHTQIPPGYGVGLAHAYSGTCAIDIDSWEHAAALLHDSGIDLSALYTALDAVTIESGRQGRGKLLYAMPFGITLPSKKINYTKSDGTRQVAFELRCSTTSNLTTQDVLPPTLHPLTNQPYQWGGKGRWDSLPIIPTELLTLWQDLTKQDTDRTITTDTVDASWSDIHTALNTIPADCSRDDWLTCAMALHHAGTQVNQLDQAFNLFHEWSATGTAKYKGPRDIEIVWRSLKADNGIKIGSLFHTAIKYGYKRPIPDVSTLFKTVVPEAPVSVLDGMRVPAPPMDMSLWPEIIRTRAMEVSESVGCDPLVPLFAGLATICAAVDAQTRLELMPGYEVPPVLWLMTIGDPADKKTPGARPMMSVLTQIEKEDRTRYQQALLEWEALDSVHQQSRKAYILAAGQNTGTILSGQLDNDTLPPVAPAPPAKPVDVKLVVNDITSQKLVRIVADRPRGVMCHLDEMASWVAKLTDPRSGEDRSCWTKSYEADTYAMDRVGAENTIYAENMAVSIYGNIQPAVFRDKLRQMSNDGLLQRFIPAVLSMEHTKRGEPIPDMFTNRSQWEMKVREVYALPKSTYKLSQSAYEAFREFQAWYERTKRDERLLNADPVYMQAFGKLEGTCGRLILVLHLIQSPYEREVSRTTTMAAIHIVRSYIVPAYRYALGDTGGLQEDSIERWIAERIVQLSGNTPTVSMRELKHAARRRLVDIPNQRHTAVIADAMEPLEMCGWVTVVNDHKDRKTWAINPALAVQHAAYHTDIVKAKQRRLDDSRAIVLAAGKSTPRRLVKGYDPETMD